MHPRIWGRDTWRSIHYIALGYPVHASPDIQRVYLAYFEALGPVLPCVKCSTHYSEHLLSYPIQPSLIGRAELFRWTVDLHNAVNASLGRQPWTYEHAFEVYADRQTSRESDHPGIRVATIAVPFVLVVGLSIWWIRKRPRH